MIGRSDIITAARSAKDLPPFPDVVIRLEKEMSRPDVSIERMVALLEQDVSLVAQLIRVVNSAYYAGKSQITTVRDAAVRLGMQELRRIIYAAAVVGRYRKFANDGAERFWAHSLAVAMASRAICKFCRVRIPSETIESAYVAGLLHDLGALVLLHAFPDDCTIIAGTVHDSGGTISDAELRAWGIDHGEVGSLLAQAWGLPLGVQLAIGHHHQPWLVEADQRPLVRLVHIADFVCTNQGYGRDESGFPVWFDAESWDCLGLSLDDSQKIIDQVRIESDKSVVLARTLTTS